MLFLALHNPNIKVRY